MRILLKKFGSVLISRPSGKEAWSVLQQTLEQVTPNEKVEVDFEGVSVLTPSWADEFITPLREQFGDKLVLLHTENPSVKATLNTLKKADDEKKKNL